MKNWHKSGNSEVSILFACEWQPPCAVFPAVSAGLWQFKV